MTAPSTDVVVASGDPDRAAPDRPARRADAVCLPVLVAAYVLAVLIVSPRGDFALIDDWAHALAVRHLVDDGRIQIPDWSAMTLVGQVAWGALFTKLFGFSFTALRISTLVLALVAGVAMYVLCRQLRVRPPAALVGALALWFNPIMFSLSYTFMTDVPFLACSLLAMVWYVRGVQRCRDRDLLIGSVLAGVAFLIRQHGLLLPVAFVAYTVIAGGPRRDRLRRGLAAAAPAAAIAAGYAVWTRIAGLPKVQDEHIDILLHHSSGALAPALTLSGYVVAYLGLFWLPVALGLAPAAVRTVADRLRARPRTAVPLLAWLAVVTAGVVVFAFGWRRPHRAGGLVVYGHGGWMPYLKDGSMITLPGIGPNDLRGVRAVFFTTPLRVALTVLVAASLVLLGTVVAGRTAGRAQRPAPVRLLLTIGAFQFAGVVLVSVRLFVDSPDWLSFDRYLLPLVPVLIVLGLWATRGWRLSTPLVVVGLLGFALFSLAGTQDWLSANRVRWDLARELVDRDVPPDRIDAGLEWDAWQLYGRPGRPRTTDGPFWTSIAAPATDSTYVISFSPQPGYRTIERREYPSWLHTGPVYLFVLQRSPA